jgi:phospholipid N-methyltransferase
MQTVTIPHIVERLQQLSDERRLVVYDFVSYVADREAERSDYESQTVCRTARTTPPAA